MRKTSCSCSAAKNVTSSNLLWEGSGFLLLYKRLEDGAFSWPRSGDEAAALTEKQYRMLMDGLNPFPRKKIREIHPQKVL